MPESPFQSVRPGRSMTASETNRLGAVAGQISRQLGGPGINVSYGPGGMVIENTMPGLILVRITGAGTYVDFGGGGQEKNYTKWPWVEQVWDGTKFVDGSQSGTVTSVPLIGPSTGVNNNSNNYASCANHDLLPPNDSWSRAARIWAYPSIDGSYLVAVIPPEATEGNSGIVTTKEQFFAGVKVFQTDDVWINPLKLGDFESVNHYFFSISRGVDNSGGGGANEESILKITGLFGTGGSIPASESPIISIYLDCIGGTNKPRLLLRRESGSSYDVQYAITNSGGAVLNGVWGTAPTGMVVSGGIVTALGSGGTGTVTSVGLSMPANEFSVTNTPVTSSGTLTVGWTVKSANYVFAGPASGPDATPAFRRLVAADLPAGTGTVTSVGLSMPGNEFQVLESPITTNGTISVVWNEIPANRVMAGPTSGGDGTPFFRSLVLADLPVGTLSWSSVPASASASGVAGEIARDTNYLYICVADNTWKRVALATW